MESGERYGRLIAIKFAERDKNGNPKWLFKCDCGNQKVIYAKSVTLGNSRSCGCYKREYNKSHHNYKHNSCYTRLYRIWVHMKERCFQQNCSAYKDYGARGISICKDWLEFENFKRWANENGYSERLTIDRINNDGNYEPSNCRWVDWYVQANNKRNNVVISAFGESHTVSEWSRIKNINFGTLYSRLYRNKMSIEEALTKGVD